MNLSVLALLGVLVVIAAVSWRRGAYAVAIGCVAAAVLPAMSLVRTTHPALLTLLGLVLAALVWHRYGRTMATVTRWGASARRKAGVASSTDIARLGSAVAMRRRAPNVRPSLAAGNRRERALQLLALPATEVGVELCRVGAQKVWASIEEVVLVFGGPRKGKTQWLAGRVIDAPGAVLVTSTRLDLLDQIGPLRAQVGPVYVFNPVGLGGRESTITFDPLTGCADPKTAHERAADMLAAANRGTGGDREFWDEQGRRNLAALMHAAALGGLTMSDVGDWVSDLDQHANQIIGLLRTKSPEQAFVASITQFIGTNSKTRTSITSTIGPALGWLTHGPAREAAAPIAAGGVPFDVAALLASRATVYMLGGEEAQVTPLVCALTGYIAREARRLAADQPSGRLDPPLSLRLDEAALICPIPLAKWSADMGGRGVSIVACFQSRAQLVDRYGEAKAAVILNNSGARVLFGGTADRDDLNYWSTLAGDREEPITTTDLHGRVASRTTRRVPVLAPAQLASLPPGRVVVFRGDMPPVVGRAEQAWRRHDVHDFHHPDALTVRARAWRRCQAAAAARWIADATRPARVRTRAGYRAVAAWCAARWTALRVRVTGHGGPTGYLHPQVVPGEVIDPTDHEMPAPSDAPGPRIWPGGEVIPFPSPWARPHANGQHEANREPDDDDLDT
ncbi:MAG: TraM recognition domain-containing protein, partial [Pseudonocardia sp.]|nr:TraM recognition domain-containing protein [Pseudonocardia sp.]